MTARLAELADPQRRGRPRNPEADQAILRAARSVFAQKGFTGASMEEIARTAGVGKDTLYRRWSSKQELVRHLLTVLAEENVPVPVEEDPHYALFVFLQDIVRFNLRADFGAIVAGLVGESARNPELASAFQDFWRERRRIVIDLIRLIAGPDATETDVEIAADRVVGPIYYRLLLTGSSIDQEYLWDLITAIPWTPDPFESATKQTSP